MGQSTFLIRIHFTQPLNSLGSQHPKKPRTKDAARLDMLAGQGLSILLSSGYKSQAPKGANTAPVLFQEKSDIKDHGETNNAKPDAPEPHVAYLLQPQSLHGHSRGPEDPPTSMPLSGSGPVLSLSLPLQRKPSRRRNVNKRKAPRPREEPQWKNSILRARQRGSWLPASVCK